MNTTDLVCYHDLPIFPKPICSKCILVYEGIEKSSKYWEDMNKKEAYGSMHGGYNDFDNFPVYNELMELFYLNNEVLDFACGVGRNIPILSKNFKNVYAYDFKNMISYIPQDIKNLSNLKIYLDFEEIKNKKFENVLASFCLSHVYVKDLLPLLEIFANMTNNLVVHSTYLIDFTGEPIIPIIEKYFILNDIIHSIPDKTHFIGKFTNK
jgi:hypothetical protein